MRFPLHILETRMLTGGRLAYDAAFTKFEKLKGSKKEKERKEAEDEYERARDRLYAPLFLPLLLLRICAFRSPR